MMYHNYNNNMKKDTGKNNQLRHAEKFSFIPFLDPDRLTKLPITSIYVHRERILVENNSYEVMNSVYGTIGNKFRLYKGSNATARYSVLLAELDRHGGCHYS